MAIGVTKVVVIARSNSVAEIGVVLVIGTDVMEVMIVEIGVTKRIAPLKFQPAHQLNLLVTMDPA